MTRDEIIAELKKFIIQSLYREDMESGEIGEETPLFEEEGLGLDSLDAVEFACFLEKKYGVEIRNGEEAKRVFSSLNSIADYVLQVGARGQG